MVPYDNTMECSRIYILFKEKKLDDGTSVIDDKNTFWILKNNCTGINVGEYHYFEPNIDFYFSDYLSETVKVIVAFSKLTNSEKIIAVTAGAADADLVVDAINNGSYHFLFKARAIHVNFFNFKLKEINMQIDKIKYLLTDLRTHFNNNSQKVNESFDLINNHLVAIHDEVSLPNYNILKGD